jgi:hypothetical protein
MRWKPLKTIDNPGLYGRVVPRVGRALPPESLAVANSVIRQTSASVGAFSSFELARTQVQVIDSATTLLTFSVCKAGKKCIYTARGFQFSSCPRILGCSQREYAMRKGSIWPYLRGHTK